MDLLKGKVAVITGASKGIGRVMSRLFAAQGAAVVCAARSGALVQETAALITKDGGKAIAFTGDAAKEADVKAMVAAGLKAFGKIDTLVNNAGDGGPTKPVQEYTEEDWFYTINSCLTSSYMCIRFIVPEMIKAGGGAIVNIASGVMPRCLAWPSMTRSMRSPSMAPGATQLTVMLCWASSIAMPNVMPTWPALAAQYPMR